MFMIGCLLRSSASYSAPEGFGVLVMRIGVLVFVSGLSQYLSLSSESLYADLVSIN